MLEKVGKWIWLWFGRVVLVAIFIFMLVDTIEKGQLWSNVLILILVVLAYREGRQNENTRIYSLPLQKIEQEQEKRKADGDALLRRLGKGKD